MSAQIILTRDSGWADYMSKYNVVINGKVFSKIKNGERKAIDIETGEIEIFISISILWRSNKLALTIQDGDQIHLKCKSNFRGLRLFLGIIFSIFFPHKWIILERE